eukprot:TRINITY_DN12004_c0_g1_i1.p1 TRINITY_DN12004_c0_g1~~TRINITY_DN12004_c0_g1_i1.p1  ORF type:complete len:503 (+),score=55.00 TRINITY_DN12004_c0_g1_i1:291-1799(+)
MLRVTVGNREIPSHALIVPLPADVRRILFETRRRGTAYTVDCPRATAAAAKHRRPVVGVSVAALATLGRRAARRSGHLPEPAVADPRAEATSQDLPATASRPQCPVMGVSLPGTDAAGLLATPSVHPLEAAIAAAAVAGEPTCSVATQHVFLDAHGRPPQRVYADCRSAALDTPIGVLPSPLQSSASASFPGDAARSDTSALEGGNPPRAGLSVVCVAQNAGLTRLRSRRPLHLMTSTLGGSAGAAATSDGPVTVGPAIQDDPGGGAGHAAEGDDDRTCRKTRRSAAGAHLCACGGTTSCCNVFGEGDAPSAATAWMNDTPTSVPQSCSSGRSGAATLNDTPVPPSAAALSGRLHFVDGGLPLHSQTHGLPSLSDPSGPSASDAVGVARDASYHAAVEANAAPWVACGKAAGAYNGAADFDDPTPRKDGCSPGPVVIPGPPCAPGERLWGVTVPVSESSAAPLPVSRKRCRDADHSAAARRYHNAVLATSCAAGGSADPAGE